MVGIFGGDALRRLAAATLADQIKPSRRSIANVQGPQAPVAESKLAKPKPLRLKEKENLHFWVREVYVAMDAALISIERPRGAFALSNLGDREKTWAYTREATSPGCFTFICAEAMSRVALQPGHSCANRFELRSSWRNSTIASSFASLSASKISANGMSTSLAVFMDELKVSPARTQWFHVQANTMEVVIQIAQQEEYSHYQIGSCFCLTRQ
ncbi:Gag protein [Phytophthora palmivora]|uniref:Gag protein n=1 Tax=Phytophthora palmivora TaxID=4796 RepID=A0A2P4YUN8_9STRA|nr:Gag protein [Phytophthora palmivora]